MPGQGGCRRQHGSCRVGGRGPGHARVGHTTKKELAQPGVLAKGLYGKRALTHTRGRCPGKGGSDDGRAAGGARQRVGAGIGRRLAAREELRWLLAVTHQPPCSHRVAEGFAPTVGRAPAQFWAGAALWAAAMLTTPAAGCPGRQQGAAAGAWSAVHRQHIWGKGSCGGSAPPSVLAHVSGGPGGWGPWVQQHSRHT